MPAQAGIHDFLSKRTKTQPPQALTKNPKLPKSPEHSTPRHDHPFFRVRFLRKFILTICYNLKNRPMLHVERFVTER